MDDVLTIADEILKIAKRKGRQLTPLQLMKLVYISHGWSFPILGKDLFGNRIEAWKYGPVIPDLYHVTKQYGREPIPLDMIDDPETSAVDAPTRRFLENVFEQYGHLSGVALSSLTHRAGTPWDQVYRDDVFNIEIPDDLIRAHYQQRYDEHQSRTAA